MKRAPAKTALRWDAPATGDGYELLFSGERFELGAAAAEVARLWLEGKTHDAIARALGRRFGETFSASDVRACIEGLASLREGAAAEEERGAAFSTATRTGMLDLRKSPLVEPDERKIRRGLAAARDRNGPWSPMVGALSPHGNLDLTSPCAFRAYSRLRKDAWPDVFVVLATSHYDPAPSVLTLDVRTSHGVVENDRALGRTVLEALPRGAQLDSPAFLVEHSWQVDLPILQVLAKDFGRPLRLVPVLVGRHTSFDEGRKLGARLSRAFFESRTRAFVLASGDLSHFGRSYAWRPSWSARGKTVGQVCAALAKMEATALEAVAARDGKTFARVAGASSFCARSQVSALVAAVPSSGEVLERRSVVDFVRKIVPTRKWTDADDVYDVASVAFHLSPPTRDVRRRKPRCRRVLVDVRGERARVFHACDASELELSGGALTLMLAMVDGVFLERDLQRIARANGMTVSLDDVRGLASQLEELGLVHDEERPSLAPSRWQLVRGKNAIAAARATVDAHASLRSNDVRRAPFVDGAALTLGGRAFLAREAASRSWRELDRLHTVRLSSGSSGGKRVVSVVERATELARADAERILGLAPARSASLNRVSNLFDQRELAILGATGVVPGRSLLASEENGYLRLAPGADPFEVPASIWKQVAARLREFAPLVLEGDPAFVAALGLHLLARGERIPSLERIELGHSYAWRAVTSTIERAFAVPIRRRFHSSELGPIAVECDRGALHLLEAHVLYELIAKGRDARRGELAALVATTLDTAVRPLVRYVPGDVVRPVAGACSCGRPFRTVTLEGRVGALFRDRRGRLRTQRDLDRAVDVVPGATFVACRIRRGGSLLLTLVPDGAKRAVDVASLRDRVRERLHMSVEVRFARALDVREKVVTVQNDAGLIPLSPTFFRE